MLWSGLCYFLNGARRHKVLLGELSEHRRCEFSESRTNKTCRTLHLGNTKQAGLHLRHIHSPYTALKRSAHRLNLSSPKLEFNHLSFPTKRADALASALLYIILLHLQNNSFAHLINHFPTAVSIYTFVHKVNACMHFYPFCVKNIDKSTFLSNLSFSK